MATTSRLFGGSMSPEEMQRELLDKRATEFTQQSLNQQMGNLAYNAGSSVGTGLAGAFGVDVRDPVLKRAAKLKELAGQFNTNTAEGLKQYASALRTIDPEMSFEASQKAFAMEEQEVDLSTKRASQDKLKNAAAQEALFRKAIVDLGPNPTQAQLLSTASRFGDAKTLVASLQVSADKAEARTVREEEFTAKQTENARLQKERLIADAEKAKDTRIDRQASLQANMAFAAALKGAPKLAPGLQKSEDEDLAKINSGIAQQATFAKPLESLMPDPQTGIPLLELGPLKNQQYKLANARGKSTPASRAYEQYQAAFTEATNIKTDAAKGVQTDSDVLRQANGIITAFGKNDNAASIEALTRFNAAIDRAGVGTKQIVEARRKSQGVELYYGKPAAAAASTSRSFASERAATAANLPKGTQITINGRKAVVE
jgi:hypothetical protein